MTDDPAPPGPAFRRRRIELNSPTGDGVMSGIEMGPADRSVDLVFNHANGFNALTYRRLLAPIAERGFRVLAIDQRGHGRSELEADPGDGHGSWIGYRDDLIALLEALGSPPRVVAGHSMGGTAGILAAGARPDLVNRLVLLDPVVMPEGLAQSLGPDGFKDSPLAAGARRRRNRFESRQGAYDAYLGRGAFRTWPPEVLADYLADGLLEREDGGLTLACAPEWESANFASHDHNPWEALFASRCPIRILRAEEGSTANIMDRADELRATGRITVETIPGTSHFLPMEEPEVCRAALREALG